LKTVLEKFKAIVAILFVILISLVAFVGVWKKENGAWKNLVKDYEYGMDIAGARELRYAIDSTEEEKYVYVDENGDVKGEVWENGTAITEEHEAEHEEEETSDEEMSEEVSDEEVPYSKETKTIKVNEDSSLTKENFEKTKKIIQKRLKQQGLGEYEIRLDDVTGNLVIQNKNDEEEISKIEELVSNPGKFQIIDYQNGLILMDNSDIKKVSTVYSNSSSYAVYLQIEFNKNGAEKLRELSTKYVEIKDESAEETEEESTEAEAERKYISVVLDGTTLMTTYFGEEMTQGLIQIPVGNTTTDYQTFVENYNSAKLISDTLNSGILPVTYVIETDNFVKSSITSDVIKNFVIVSVVVFAVISLLYIVRFKLNGVIAVILNIGYIALYLLVVRYAFAEITLVGMITGFLMIIINYIFVNNILKSVEQSYSEVAKKFYLSIIPVIVVSVVFTLQLNYMISGIGMIAFWGIILNIIYNLIFTKTILKK